jgi:hypothetical protein
MGVIDGRMQGSDKNFKKMSDTITDKLAVSPFVKSTQVLEKLKEASELGLSYNTEQRAFLAEVSEKIANTFNAFDSNLLRIIRLQQADTTATRLGMEASLTKLFNGMFQDSSYLKNVSDSITGAIVDATSQLNYKASAEFEFVVQKWLGALSSLGMSDNSLTQIATGLNYLATGDVTNLANNNSLQTMFAMAASNANLEYSEILLNGLDAGTTNKLLESVVLYLKDIAENSDNQVVKAAYGDIFSMSLSDMKAISNLTSQEISTLAGTNMSYSDMKSEIDNQMNQLWNRTSLASMMTNMFENVIYSVASDMTNDPVMFTMQKMLNFMNDTGTDINIPFINAMGFGLDLNASVKDLMQMGVGIGQAFSLTGNILSGLSSGGGTDLDSWGATETTKRGTGLNLMSGSTLGGVSGSMGTYATSGNSSDVKNSTMTSATDDAEDTKKVTNKNSKAPEHTIDDLISAVVGGNASEYVLTKDEKIDSVYDVDSKSLNVTMKDLIFDSGLLLVRDDLLFELISGHYEKAPKNTMDNLLALVEGTSAGSYINTKDSILDKVFNDSAKSLNANITNLEFESDGSLKIRDSGLVSMMTKKTDDNEEAVTLYDLLDSVLGDSAKTHIKTKDSILGEVYNETGKALNVAVSGAEFEDNCLKVKVSGLSENLSTALTSIKEFVSAEPERVVTVKLDKDEKVTVVIDTSEITAAVRSALFGESGREDFYGMIQTVANGELSVKSVSDPVMVKNYTGDKLQVSNLVW